MGDDTNDCPYACDLIKALGGPQMSCANIALAGLVLFLAAMYFSDKGLERRPFGTQHIGCWCLAVIGGVVFMLAAIPFALREMWPFLMMADRS